MKRVFIAALVVLLASVLLVAAIEYDPGYLLLSYGVYTLETSIWVAVGLFVALFVVVYVFFSLVRRMLQGSSSIANWFSGRSSRRGHQLTTRGIIAFIEGNWQSSRRMLSRAASKSETPLLNYLIAARASHELGDGQQMKEYLKKAEQTTSSAAVAVGITQAELQLKAGHFEQGLATLMRVRRNVSQHPYVLFLLQRAYTGLQDWEAVLELLPELKKYKVLSPEELEKLELNATINCLGDAAKSRDDRLSALHKLWQKLPKAMIRNSEVVATYCEYILAAGGGAEAEKIIREQLKRDWHPALVRLYGVAEGADVGRQLRHAEAWLQERTNDAALLLCLGRLSLRTLQWGKAREYFETSLKLEQMGEACAELGRLLASLGEFEKSNAYFQQGLQLGTNKLPELPSPENK